MEGQADKDGMLGVEQIDGMSFSNGEFQELRVVLNNRLRHMMSTAVTFDTHAQLFWVGTESGHVTSYFGPNFMKYTAFQAHHDYVQTILPDAHGVLSLSPNQVRYTTKEGLKIFSAGAENMHSMQSMVRGYNIHDNLVLIAGQNEHFFELDLTSGYIYEKKEVSCVPSTVVMKQQPHGYLCCGQQSGEVILYDPDTLETCHTLEAHSGSLSDFDLHGNLLVTCGFSTRYDHLAVDPYLMLYDIRTLRPFPTVQVPVEPFFVRFMPTYTLRCLVVSQSGQFILAQPDSIVVDPGVYQLNNQGQAIMDCCVSESYQCFGFGDSAGCFHIWSDRDGSQLIFNHGEQHVVLPDEAQPLDAFDVDDWSIPLTNIPMPYSTEPLLSDWPEHLLRREDRPTPPIDQDILKTMTIRQFVGYAPNPKTRLRNQVAYSLNDEGHYKSPESPMSRDNESSLVPKMYRKVDIKYSKYGVEDFNFRHYNQTKFSGLEIHIPNAYCNSMLQVFYFIDVLRVGMQNHFCQREFCVACELGFLCYMLDISDGQTCQASNFLRTFRTLPEASALGLLINDSDSGRKNKSIAQTIQNWTRFVLRQLHQDTKEKKEDKSASILEESESNLVVSSLEVDSAEGKSIVNEDVESASESTEKNHSFNHSFNKESEFEDPSLVKDLFGMDILSCRTCKCGSQHERKVTIFATDIAYPDMKQDVEEVYPFTQLLQESIMRRQNTQAWCDNCNKYQNSKQFRKILSLPDVLVINCQLEHAKEIEFWKRQQQIADPKSDLRSIQSSPPKMCRYGKFCNRPGCKFIHLGRDGDPKVPAKEGQGNDESSMRTWIPADLELLHNRETSEVLLSTDEKDANDSGSGDDDKEKVKEDISEEGGDCKDSSDTSRKSVYRLISNVCHINDCTTGSTLVSHIRVNNAYHKRKGDQEKDQWYVFNDFAITPIAKHDALTFNMDWKIPCVLVYARHDIEKSYETEVRLQIDSAILFADKSLSTTRERFSRHFTALNPSEILKEGDIVGVDAEFVSLNQEESEMRRDGTLSTLRPSQMSVARITVVRGWDPLPGVPFIDDYISTSEQVVDYLTKFSGIKPGDLDASMSSKHLTTLKTSYLKLRYLIDAKVFFIGHGLKKDFRVINLVIPRDQVVDTVELFHLPKQRFVSLKFLAWHFLNIKIQADTHDSAEDAYTALKLYEKYRELLRAGEWVLEEELEILYETGRQYSWQVPE